MKKYSNEFKVGIFFFACMLGLIYFSFSTGKIDIKNEGYNLNVVFNEIAGLDIKAPVMLNGREVGKVEDIIISHEADETKITLKLWLAKGARVREGSKASIKTLGLMGEKYIQITSTKGERFLEPGAILTGKPYMDLDALMDEAMSISEDIGVLVNNINGLTDEVKKLTVNLNYTVEGNQDKISKIVDNLEITSKNIEEFTEDIKRHPWKLLYKKRDKASSK